MSFKNANDQLRAGETTGAWASGSRAGGRLRVRPATARRRPEGSRPGDPREGRPRTAMDSREVGRLGSRAASAVARVAPSPRRARALDAVGHGWYNTPLALNPDTNLF